MLLQKEIVSFQYIKTNAVVIHIKTLAVPYHKESNSNTVPKLEKRKFALYNVDQHNMFKDFFFRWNCTFKLATIKQGLKNNMFDYYINQSVWPFYPVFCYQNKTVIAL